MATTTTMSGALRGFHPEMPCPGFGLSVWMQSDGSTALSFVSADGVGALVGSDTDDAILWGPTGFRYDFQDLPDEAIEYRSIWNVADHAEAILRMARRSLADYRASLLEERDPAVALQRKMWRPRR
jgi:hypothetical protein